MEFSAVVRADTLVIRWCLAHHHRRSATRTATVTKKESTALTSVDKPRTVRAARRASAADAVPSVIRDRVQRDSCVRTEPAWRDVVRTRTVQARDRVPTRSVSIHAPEERLAERMPSARLPTTRRCACVRTDSRVILGKDASNTNAKRTKTAIWTRSVSPESVPIRAWSTTRAA